MASQGAATNSRLAEMQMKFQKKQMLEREQKKLTLTGSDVSTSDISVTAKNKIGNGKVRQMFDERRRGVGIDRSHPLRPIMSSTTTTATTKSLTQQPSNNNKRPVGGASVPRRPVIPNTTLKQGSLTNSTRSLNNNHSASNGKNSLFNNNLDEVDSLDNETFPKEFSSLSLNNTCITASYVDRNFDNNSNDNSETDVLDATVVINKNSNPKANGIKLNPVITKKSPITTTTKTSTQYRTPSSGSRVSTLSRTATTSTTKSPLQTSISPTSKTVKATVAKTSNPKPATFVLSVKPPPRITTPPAGMAACQYCQRHFVEERLDKHEEVCKKMTSKKRKIFDASKHRVKGTEAEKYVRKGKVSNPSAPKKIIAAVTNNTTQGAKSSDGKKSSWRKKHEEFIAAIREAKKVQAYLAKGGKLSDLPPPPPSENPDYVQCPHCNRRFNESAAERHIPKCANMQHNKPKPSAANLQRKRY